MCITFSRSATSSGLVVELFVTSRNGSPRRRASARNPAAPAIGSRPVYTTPSRSIKRPRTAVQSSVTPASIRACSGFAEDAAQVAVGLLQKAAGFFGRDAELEDDDGRLHLTGALLQG